MSFQEQLRNCLPDTSAWPKVAEVWQIGVENPRPEWDMPLIAAEALGKEDSYWALARAKSSPFFAGGLQMGAILAEANAKTRKLFIT